MSRKNKSPKKNKANKAKLGKKAIIAGVRSHFIENPFGSFNYKQVAHIMGVNDRTSKNLIKDTLEELAIKGELEQLRRGKFKIKPEKLTSEKAFKVTHEGKVDMKQTGKAYVTSPEMGEDIFIGANHTGHALPVSYTHLDVYKRQVKCFALYH